jgi:hypothetical protein
MKANSLDPEVLRQEKEEIPILFVLTSFKKVKNRIHSFL